VLDAATGLKAFFISKDDLIAAKLASGRPQDLADVSAMRKASEGRRFRLAVAKGRSNSARFPARAGRLSDRVIVSFITRCYKTRVKCFGQRDAYRDPPEVRFSVARHYHSLN
jgi:hypothetical protein